jgi:hypothetical protein
MVVQQESDFVNVNNADVNTSEKKKIVASMTTVGSILGLSKKNPVPVVRLNPYVNIDQATGSVLPHPVFNNIIEETDRLLANITVSDEINDNDEFVPDLLVEGVEIEDEDSGNDDFELMDQIETD